MIDFVFGKGRGKKFEMTIGMAEAKVDDRMRDETLSNIVEALARQCKLTDGVIGVEAITFSIERNRDE